MSNNEGNSHTVDTTSCLKEWRRKPLARHNSI